MADPAPPLVPLVVVSTGLPGTIRPVMDLLGRMDETFTEWTPETQRRPLIYLLRHAQVLAGDRIEDAQWNHETVFYPPTEGEVGTRRIAGFPSPSAHVGGDLDGVPLWQRCLEANWRGYCQRLELRPAHRYYAEPASVWCPDALLHAQMPYRALFIVRDPRSELAEQWMAGRRRGVLPAVLTHDDTPLSFAERQATHAVRTSLLRLAELQPGATQLCIRYEDLIGQTAEVWARLRSWLQLESRPAPPPPGTGDEWPANRWRQCLPDSVSALYDQRMRGEMEAHGYAI